MSSKKSAPGGPVDQATKQPSRLDTAAEIREGIAAARRDDTPLRRALLILGELEDHFHVMPHFESWSAFIEVMLREDAKPDGDFLLAMLGSGWDDDHLPTNEVAQVAALEIAATFAVQAIRSHKAGAQREAWAFVADASHWAGLVEGSTLTATDAAYLHRKAVSSRLPRGLPKGTKLVPDVQASERTLRRRQKAERTGS